MRTLRSRKKKGIFDSLIQLGRQPVFLNQNKVFNCNVDAVTRRVLILPTLISQRMSSWSGSDTVAILIHRELICTYFAMNSLIENFLCTWSEAQFLLVYLVMWILNVSGYWFKAECA